MVDLFKTDRPPEATPRVYFGACLEVDETGAIIPEAA